MSRALVVGSSPQLLIDAIDLARAGWQVEVVEGRDRLGGSWAVTHFAGWDDVELACHLFERDDVAAARLREFGVDLEPMTPPPETRPWRPLHLPYVSRAAAAAQLAWYPVARARGAVRRTDVPAHVWRRRRRLHLKELGDAWRDRSPVWTVVGGAGGLVATLAGAAVADGVTIGCDRRVERVSVDDDGVGVLVAGETERADLVVLPAAFEPSRLRIGGAPVAGPVWRRSFSHLLMAFGAGTVAPHSYVRFPRDPVIQRSSDVTRAAVPTADAVGDELLLVSVRCDLDGQPTAELDEVLGRLRHHRILPDGAEPLACEAHRYEGRDAHAALATAVAEVPSVRLLRSFGDVTRCIAGAPPVPRPVVRRASRAGAS